MLNAVKEISPIDIRHVETGKDWRDFHNLPYRVYENDPYWVPPLLLERKLHFSPKHNPFFQHAKAEFWIAYQDGMPVGRISAQIDRLHLGRHGDETGHFGFIEAIDDPGVFGQLLAAAEAWIRDSGLRKALGPVSFSLWDQPGLLVDGFDAPPSVMMNYNHRYFEPHIIAAGYSPAQDMLTYEYDGRLPFPDRAMRLVEWARKRESITVRPIRKDSKNIDQEIALLLDIINDAWSDNWGFVPMTKAEIADLATVFKILLRPGDVAIAEYHGKAVAFALIMPNLNEVIRDLGGRLLPFGWARILWRLKIKKPFTARMPLMGVRKSLQSSPLGAALALMVIQETRIFNIENGTPIGELSWILDQNEGVKNVIDLVGATQRKRYRLFEKSLG